jgi:hypothetical protein
MYAQLFIRNTSPQVTIPGADAGDKKFNSRPVAPTVLGMKPFRENVKGLLFAPTGFAASRSCSNSAARGSAVPA